MSTKALFPCGGGSNLILGTGTESQIFILITPATIKFFHQILKNCHFGVKKNHYPPEKLNFVSTPRKIIIPLGNSVGAFMWFIQIHLGG